MKDKWKRILAILKDYRCYVAVAAALILVIADIAFSGVFFWSLVAVFVAVGVAHLVRRLFFPYFDVSALYERALKDGVGAGVALVAIAIVFGSVVVASMLVLIKVT